MKRIEITCSDVAKMTTTRQTTPEGYLRATAALTTVGVQDYLGSELPDVMGIGPSDLVGVYRPAATVFHSDTIASAQMKPVTYRHPASGVFPENFRMLSVGHLGEVISPLDEKRLGGPVLIMDKATVEMLNSGEYETSLGYNATLVEEEGTYEGKPYRFRFDGPMQVNHLAIVENGRCGKSVKILDKGVQEMTKEEIQALISDALASHKPAFKDEDIKSVVVAALGDALKGIKDEVAALAAKVEAKVEDQDFVCPQCKKAMGDKAKCDACGYTKDAAPDMNDAVAARIVLLDTCRPLLNDEDKAKALKMSDRELIVAALGDSVKDAASKSDEYLRGMLDSIIADRAANAEQLGDAGKATGEALDTPISGIAARDL